MRGTAQALLDLPTVRGITPAHAGNSPPPAALHHIFWDHPRSCGEQVLENVRAANTWGSPPLMRGTVKSGNFQGILPGITPAHAGNRDKPSIVVFDVQDHPRSCGEQTIALALMPLSLKSPPLMRGTDACNGGASINYGITPAHAGNSEPVVLAAGMCGDHPRSCGEQLSSYYLLGL